MTEEAQSPDRGIVIDARGLVKRYEETVAVAGIDLGVAAGEVHGMVGPNGAGKTTVLSMLLGLIRPDAGSLALFGRSYSESGQRTLDGVAGFIENPRFYPYLSGPANLALLAGLDTPAARERIPRVLDAVGLKPTKARLSGYSLGMRQRLGLAAALLRDPRLLVLDEPANGLDPAGMRDMRTTIRRLADDGLTVLLSSHNMDEVEDLCDNVTIMRSGAVIFRGSIREMRTRAPDPIFRLRTSDDERASIIARDVPGVRVQVDDGLVVHAQRERIDAYTIALGRADVAVRALELTMRPLAALFFQLTEPEQPVALVEPEPVR